MWSLVREGGKLERQVCTGKEEDQEEKSGDEGPPPKSSWELFESMSFIDETIRHRS